MTVLSHKEILEKAIKKAEANGWMPLKDIPTLQIDQWRGDHAVEVAVLFGDHQEITWVRELEGIIFNHDFAKALWGEDKEVWYCNNEMGCSNDSLEEMPDKPCFCGWWGYRKHTVHPYQLHLQAMVISDDPIEYLERNI